MNNLSFYLESFTNGFSFSILSIITMISILCGVLVIISKNPIVSVLFLIGLFFSIACYLMMLGLNFIGLSYLLVYVGAVSILFLFILMLINVRVSELVTDTSNSLPLAFFIGVLFNTTLNNNLPSENLSGNYSSDEIAFNFSSLLNKDLSLYFQNMFSFSQKKEILLVTSQRWDGALSETSHITSIGNVLYTVYPMWLIVTSIILLLAMVGAIVITLKQ